MLDSLFRNNGFSVLYPEEVSLTKMIGYLQHARFIASESNSICFNGIFAGLESEYIIMERYASFDSCQVLL